MLIQDLALIAKDAQNYIKKKRASLALTGIEQTVSLHIYLHGQSNQTQLAEMLLMDKGNMAKILASLETEGCVKRERNPVDRRENLISLTAEGEGLIQEVIEFCAQWEEMALSVLSEEEATMFKMLVEKINQGLGSAEGTS